MTTKQFINKALQGTTRSKQCSSVFVGDDRTIYSYGYHYPLVKIIDGKAFINSRGYSVSTSKHIGWAFAAAAEIVGYENTFHAPTTYGLHKGGIVRGVSEEITRLEAVMATKKRKDTQVYKWLAYNRDRLSKTLEATKELV